MDRWRSVIIHHRWGYRPYLLLHKVHRASCSRYRITSNKINKDTADPSALPFPSRERVRIARASFLGIFNFDPRALPLLYVVVRWKMYLSFNCSRFARGISQYRENYYSLIVDVTLELRLVIDCHLQLATAIGAQRANIIVLQTILAISTVWVRQTVTRRSSKVE